MSLSLASVGCVLAPPEADRVAEAMRRAGAPYERTFEERAIPELPAEPAWRDVLTRALLASGEVEASYHQWAAAVHRISEAGGYPNTRLFVDAGFGLSGNNVTAVDRTTITVRPDAMQNLSLPPKVYQAAKVATDEAQAAGKRFVAAKFDVQRRVLKAWAEYCLLAEKIRIQEEATSLLKLGAGSAREGLGSGGTQREYLRTDIEARMAEDSLETLKFQVPRQRAALNALMDRPADAPLALPSGLPEPRPLSADDATLLALAGEVNPELKAIGNELRGRRDALELARLQLLPDFNPFAGITGSVSQMVGVGVSIPAVMPAMHARIREARAGLDEMMAAYRQAKFDKAASVVAALSATRNSERQARLFEEDIVPAARTATDLAREGYVTGETPLPRLIESERLLLEARLGVAEAKTARETSISDLEALIGIDAEAMQPTPP